MSRLLLGLAICFFFGPIGAIHSSSVQPRLTSKEIDDLMYRLNNSVSGTLESHLPYTRGLVVQMEGKTIQIMQTAETEFRLFLDFLEVQIQELERQYQDLGVDIDACLDIYRPEIENLPKVVLDEIERCFRESITLADELTEAAVVEMYDILAIVDQLQLKVDRCTALPSGTDECYVRVAEEIIEHMYEDPFRVARVAERSWAAVRALEDLLPECYGDRVDSVETVGNAMLMLLEVCASIA